MRVSAVGFLNAAPLCWGLREGHHPADWQVGFDAPSECARKLLAGEADLGLVPCAVFAQTPDLVMAAPLCVAAAGEVTSVLLVCGGPLEEVGEVLLDPASRTSQALSRLLLERYRGLKPGYAEWRELPAALRPGQALLVIGDRALGLPPALEGLPRLDLAAEWVRATGLPFVFAAWAVRDTAVREAARPVLLDSYARGRERLREIAAEAAEQGMAPAQAEEYLRNHLHYTFGRREAESLSRFLREAFGWEMNRGCLDVAP